MASNAYKRELKAFVRLDGQGRKVSSSLIYRKNIPKVGQWVQIQAFECCDPWFTTTTTTTEA
jgi:hypothetical protein